MKLNCFFFVNFVNKQIYLQKSESFWCKNCIYLTPFTYRNGVTGISKKEFNILPLQL